MLYGELGVDFPPLLNCYIQIRNQSYTYSESDLIFTWFATTPTLVLEFLIAHFTLVVLLSLMIITKKDMLTHTPVEFNYLELLVSNIRGGQNQFNQGNIFNKAPARQFAIAMNTISAFTGSYSEKHFWYQQFDLRQTRILRSGQPIVDFGAADNCHLYVKTLKATNFQDDNPSTPVDNFRDHYVLLFQLTST